MALLSTFSVLLLSFDHHLHLRRLHLLRVLHPTSLMFFVSLAVQWITKFAGASCNAVQSSSCLQAATGDNVDHLPGAGRCIVKPYSRYTHLCTVTNYLPSTDYCCCTFEARLLCCRYHQGWYHFRCMEADDELEISVPSVTYTTNSMDLPLLTLIPVILCPLVTVAICIICLTKCWCYRHDNDSSSSSSSSSSSDFCCRCYKIVDDKSEKLPRERFAATDDDDVTSPLQHPPPSPSAPPEVVPQPGTSASCPRSAFHPPFHHRADAPLSPFFRSCNGPPGPFDAPCFLRGHPPPPRTPLICRHHPHPHGYPITEDFLGVVHHPQCHHNPSCFRRGFCHRSSIQCACAASSLSSAEARRHCDVICSSLARPGNEQTTGACADCLPPAYESIQAESSAQL